VHALPRRRTAALAAEALIVTYPLVLMDLVRAQLTATTRAGRLRAPVNQFAHMTRCAPPPLAPLITPNLDTLTSSAWLDLSAEPLVLAVPDMGGRYYAMPVYDAWTTPAAVIGARTTGPGAREFALVGPWFRGPLPRHLSVIQSRTSMAWILAQVRCDGDDDAAAVHRIQHGIRLTPLSRYGRGEGPPPDVESGVRSSAVVSSPVARIARMDPVEYFGRVARLLADNPPHRNDRVHVGRMSVLGVVPGHPPDWSPGDRPLLRAVARGMAEGLAHVEAAGEAIAGAAGPWVCPQELGHRQSDPLIRAASVWTALGALPRHDALVYTSRLDGTGRTLTGERRYTLHFAPGASPPAQAFWSLTAYDDVGFFVAGENQRPTVGDRDPLRYESDGSLVLRLQPDRPGGEQANWLQTPAGAFSLALRLYRPGPPALRGAWRPPGARPLEARSGTAPPRVPGDVPGDLTGDGLDTVPGVVPYAVGDSSRRTG